MDNCTDVMVLCIMNAIRFVQIGCALSLTKPTFWNVFVPGLFSSQGVAEREHGHCLVFQGVLLLLFFYLIFLSVKLSKSKK